MPEKNTPKLTVYNTAHQLHGGAPIMINGVNGVYTDAHGTFSLQSYIGNTIESLIINQCKANIPTNLKKITANTHLIFECVISSGHKIGTIRDSNNNHLPHSE